MDLAGCPVEATDVSLSVLISKDRIRDSRADTGSLTGYQGTACIGDFVMADTETGQTGIQPAAETNGSASVPDPPATGMIHHVELWVPDLDRAVASFGWLLTSMGYRLFQDWPGGRSWLAGQCYVVVEQSPARTASRHDRCRPGLNHLAFHVAGRQQVDQLAAEARLHGWKLMFPDLHPFAGGAEHYAAYLENADGFEVELVAS